MNGVTAGTFREGKLTGKGYLTLPQAVYPRANFGKRTFDVPRTWPAGSRLNGEFLENRLIGDGILTQPNGQQVFVNEIDGKLFRKRAAVDAAPASAKAPPQ